jgi:peptidylprolyl isomerase
MTGSTLTRRAAAATLAAAFAAPALAQGAADPQNTLYLETKDGRITIRLRPDLAPKHVAQIKALVKRGFYDGLTFHRVIEGFMAQTGDPRGNGTGGSDLPNIPAEFSATPFKRGTVGMARSSDPNSANSQFFICFGDASFLNNQYTVVGEVTSGLDVLDKVKKGSSAQNGAVSNPDKIVRMRLAADAK